MGADTSYEGYQGYKAEKEAFVSGTAGSSIMHVMLVSVVALPVGFVLAVGDACLYPLADPAFRVPPSSVLAPSSSFIPHLPFFLVSGCVDQGYRRRRNT
ncbi:hypothetical protein D9619_013273 [Psilocybe cf. subviscida]|uniref:Uncharacterized protein n=1 Tax=Psilocybe cf. subviscida TaxID=2480587 RepID=A0A8H5F9S8_9AGAR|nr:hypothetical protein D9619_013273 [Psilocybe cf. subviscida]